MDQYKTKRNLIERMGNVSAAKINSIMNDEGGFKLLDKNKSAKVTITLDITRNENETYGFDGDIKVRSEETAKEKIDYESVDDSQFMMDLKEDV